MNGTDRLERELTAWFSDAAAPSVPDYTGDILGATAAMRQRPRWSFPTRWLPAALVPRVTPLRLRPLPWRTVVLLALLGLLLAGALALYAGTRPRLPAPFGPALNGLVAYADNGDIWTIDPETGVRTSIVSGVDNDSAPRFSRDGTRIAFFRQAPGGVRLVVTSVDGTDMVVSTGAPFIDGDTDSIAWSPDGRLVAVAAGSMVDRTTYLVDSSTGAVRDLETADVDHEVYWRPPDGRQLAYVGYSGVSRLPFLLTLEDGAIREIEIPKPGIENRLGGWTPDGRYLVIHGYDEVHGWTDLIDPDTRESVRIDIGFGRLSNDGTRIVGYRDHGERLCVMSLPDGPCDEIASGDDLPDWEHAGGLHWSPDDRWIAAYPRDGGGWLLLDPAGGPPVRPAWIGRGAETWQRVEP